MTEIYYVVSPADFEVDFYLPESRQLIQVCQHLNHPSTRERETRALFDAMRGFGLTNGLILTDENAAPITEDGLTIEIRSIAEWLLSQS